jgi:hypothetical protein
VWSWQHIAMNHKTGILICYVRKMNASVEIFIIIFFTGRMKTYPAFVPIFDDSKYADTYILYLPRQCKRVQVFRLAEFFCEDDFVSWECDSSKIRKE